MNERIKDFKGKGNDKKKNIKKENKCDEEEKIMDLKGKRNDKERKSRKEAKNVREGVGRETEERKRE